MTRADQKVWRPPDRIRAKAVAIAKHLGRVLVCEVLDDEGRLKGWVPPGGGIEFGERAETALKREIKEELGISCTVVGPPAIYENIYVHEGVTGHEVIFAFPVVFDEPSIWANLRFAYRESDGESHIAEWVEIDRFKNGADTLFPGPVLPFVIGD